jgi:hypothetical protein
MRAGISGSEALQEGEGVDFADRCALRCITVSQAQNAQHHGTTYTASACSVVSLDGASRDAMVGLVRMGRVRWKNAGGLCSRDIYLEEIVIRARTRGQSQGEGESL